MRFGNLQKAVYELICERGALSVPEAAEILQKHRVHIQEVMMSLMDKQVVVRELGSRNAAGPRRYYYQPATAPEASKKS